MSSFEIVTWYDTWNQLGLQNLLNKLVPLQYATRYNLAFGQLLPVSAGYNLDMNGGYAPGVRDAIRAQAPNVTIYASIGDTGLAETVADNRANGNRSTKNIVSYLTSNGYKGVSIDSESNGMPFVAEFVGQLAPSFRSAGLGIAVSVPWPDSGPAQLYGQTAVAAFNEYVDALELQDYSSSGTRTSVPIWTNAGISPKLLMGGICTENSAVQTSIEDTIDWTKYAMKNGIRGMFSWRLDNDHGKDGTEEDVNPTFTGAKAIYDTVRAGR